MREVGLRELKNRLGTYIRYVRKGESLAITDRGEVVAELLPASSTRDAGSALAALARRGEATAASPLPKEKRSSLYRVPARRLLARASAQSLLDQERGER